MGREYIVTRRVQIFPTGNIEEINRVYQYIRDGMYCQNRAYNKLLTTVYTAIVNGKETDVINNIYKRGKRNPKQDAPEYSLYNYEEFKPPKGLSTLGTVGMKVKADIKTAQQNGLFKGKISLQNRKIDAPLWVESSQFSFYHNYSADDEFKSHLKQSDLEVFMKFVNGINFKVIFGLPHKSNALREEFARIFDGEYKVAGSSIQFDKKDKHKIILNLSLKIPKKERELDENKIVGVDVGVAIPAVCALNDNKYSRQYLGSKDDLLRVRTQLQHQRQQLQRSLRFNSGGHGRKKKLKPLERLRARERNFVRTYNHKISKRVVDFALKNNAKYINIENLKGIDTSQFILRNWSYYELQQFITYKAAKFGIEVRKINPYHTSQTCSCCGHYEPGQRERQAEFICKNPECENYGKVINADFNAARNIAMSTAFTDDEDGKKKKINKKKVK